MLIKTNTLKDLPLDWAVAEAIDGKPYLYRGKVSCLYFMGETHPSTDWSQGGPIIEREKISLRTYAFKDHEWVAYLDCGGSLVNGVKARMLGPTSLIAAMRCYVASKLGEEVDIPDELVQ